MEQDQPDLASSWKRLNGTGSAIKDPSWSPHTPATADNPWRLTKAERENSAPVDHAEVIPVHDYQGTATRPIMNDGIVVGFGIDPAAAQAAIEKPLSKKYPKYYKDVKGFDSIDVYTIHHLFDIQDPSGCIQHASKKLLLSGVRTGGKSKHDDIREARDTLTRWLDLNPK